MILDAENLFSDDQAITTTADSTNIIKLPDNAGPGNPLRLLLQVTETFAGGTSVAIDLETDDNEAMASPADIANIPAIAAATLVEGYKVEIPFLPRSNQAYSRLEYTVVGTFTTGKMTAGFIFDEQSAKNTYPT